MKKSICIILSVLLFTNVFLIFSSAEIVDSGSDQNISWTLDSEGLLTVSGEGSVRFGSAFLNKENVREVVFKEGITKILSYCFEQFERIEEVTLPESLLEIGQGAFLGCSSLSAVRIPDSVTCIYAKAFGRCSSLERVEIGSGTTYIEDFVFYGCNSLNQIIVSSDNPRYYVEGNCLIENDDWKSVIAGCVNSEISAIQNPAGVINIRYYAFYGNRRLQSLTIPSGNFVVLQSAFENCTGLETLIVAEGGIPFFDIDAFKGCTALKSVSLPNSIIELDVGAFTGCTNLTDVYFDGTEEEWNALEIYNPYSLPLETDELLTATIHFKSVHEHTPGEPVETVLTPATCGEAGEKKITVKCTVCGETISETTAEIPATGHDWGASTDAGNGTHKRVCGNDPAHVETAAHVWNDGEVTKAATCKEQGETLYACTVCGAEKTEPIVLNPANHANYGTKVENAAAATCTEAGYTGDAVCLGCGEVLIPGEVINAMGHDWGVWVNAGGGKHTRVCKHDASHTETAAHTPGAPVETVVKAPTCTAQGVKRKTVVCTECGAILSETESVIEKTQHVDVNNDGVCDNCNLTIDKDLASHSGRCVCGEYHTGPFAWLVEFFHRLVYFFKNVFNKN